MSGPAKGLGIPPCPPELQASLDDALAGLARSDAPIAKAITTLFSGRLEVPQDVEGGSRAERRAQLVLLAGVPGTDGPGAPAKPEAAALKAAFERYAQAPAYGPESIEALIEIGAAEERWRAREEANGGAIPKRKQRQAGAASAERRRENPALDAAIRKGWGAALAAPGDTLENLKAGLKSEFKSGISIRSLQRRVEALGLPTGNVGRKAAR